MKSRKTTKALEEKLSRLKQQHAEITHETDKMWKEIQAWPLQTVKAHGRTFKARTIVSAQTDRAYDDLMREKGRIECEIRELESWLSPPRGRPRQSDPRVGAAIKEWLEAKDRKPSLRFLSIKHSGLKDRTEQGKWAEKLKKTMQRTGLSSREKGK